MKSYLKDKIITTTLLLSNFWRGFNYILTTTFNQRTKIVIASLHLLNDTNSYLKINSEQRRLLAISWLDLWNTDAFKLFPSYKVSINNKSGVIKISNLGE